MSYLTTGISILNFEEIHGFYHALHGHEDVLKHEFDEAPFVFIRVTRAVDDAHLFDEC